MSWCDKLKCPYCGYEMTIGNEDFDSDSDNETDVECENEECEREFTVIREWTPTFYSQEIFFNECEECGKEDREDNMFRLSDKKYLCKSCYFEKEIEKLR